MNNNLFFHMEVGMVAKQKPGEKPNTSGEYEERGPRGGKITNPRQVTIEPLDNKLPPTQVANRTWVRVGPAKI